MRISIRPEFAGEDASSMGRTRRDGMTLGFLGLAFVWLIVIVIILDSRWS